MKCMEVVDTIGKYAVFKVFSSMNVHRNVVKKSSSSDEMGFKNLVLMRFASKFV